MHIYIKSVCKCVPAPIENLCMRWRCSVWPRRLLVKVDCIKASVPVASLLTEGLQGSRCSVVVSLLESVPDAWLPPELIFSSKG